MNSRKLPGRQQLQAVGKRELRLNWHVGLAALVLVLALALRLYGINFGFPFLYDQDEPDFVEPALEMLAAQNPNPGYFQHPASTTIYLLALTYAGIFAAGYLGGVYDSPQAFADQLYQDPSIVYLAGRTEIALFGVASVALVYLIGRRVFNPTLALLAALLAATAPLHIWISHLIRTDVMTGFFTLMAFWYCLDILEHGRWRAYVLAGVFTALATMTKYPAVFFALTVVVAHALTVTDWRSLQQHTKLVVSGIVTLAAAFITSPFLFLDFQETLRDVAFEMRPEHLSSTGEGFLPNLLWYIRNPLLDNLTVVGLILVAMGTIACWRSRHRQRMLLTVFPCTFLLFIANLSLRQERWPVPILPFFALLAAASTSWLWTFFRSRLSLRNTQLVVIGIVLFAAVPLMIMSTFQALAIAGPQTRTIAGAWMLANIPEGSRVLMALYTPQLPER